MKQIIDRTRSLIIACDVPLPLYRQILKRTSDIDEVGAYKIGLVLALKYGLPKVVQITKDYTDKPIILDYQKAGNDIPEIGYKFAKIAKQAGVDAVIILPLAGPTTQHSWISAAYEENLGVIIGGLMSHKNFLRSDNGYISDDAIKEIYGSQNDGRINDFYIAGNNPKKIRKLTEFIRGIRSDPVFYFAGLGKQGGSISDLVKIVGDNWHAIIGRDIYESGNIREATLRFVEQL